MECAEHADKRSMSAIGGMLEAPVVAISELRMRVLVLACLFIAGATLVLLTLALPHGQDTIEAGLWAGAAVAYATGGLMLRCARRVPASTLPIAIAWGATLVTGVAYCSAESPSPLCCFYLWMFLYSAYFFDLRTAIAQMLYAGALFAGLLLVNPPPSGGAAWWAVGIATMAISAIVVRVMRNHVELLVARLYDAARTDQLTQLPNRHGFRELLDLELERARRGERPMSVIVGDVDHFKEVNDRAGHAVGDAALQRVAELLRDSLRQIDTAARIGGEEFAVILPDADPTAAFVAAERVRCAVRDAFADATVPITISFGIASRPNHAETAASLLRAADEALYGAKQSGRNRTVIHSSALRGLVREGREEQDIEAERYVAVVLDLAEAVDLRFSGSARHSETVGRYAELMARELGLSEHRVGRVRLAGLLHDIGKVGVPDAILRKPGALTDDERAVILRHPELGAALLEHPSLHDVQRWVAAHHERPDGTGYPHGLAGDALPLEARIVAVADAYEAMTSDRSYRDAIGHGHARDELLRHSGTQFDGEVVAAFLAVLDREAARAAELVDQTG